MKKAILFAAFLLVTSGFVGVSVFAQDAPEDGEKFQPVVERLIEKFDLDRVAVQAELDEFYAERKEKWQEKKARWQENKEEHFQDMLTKAVEAGKITAEQKEALIGKKSEIEAEINEIKEGDLSLQEKKEQMDQIKDDMHAWLEEQGIELGLFGPFARRGFGPKKGFRTGYHLGPGFENCPMAE